MIYDKLARFYDRAFDPLDRWRLARWRAETLSLLPRNSDILEIGCGTGRNFKYYPASRTAIASEISFKMLEFAAGRDAAIEVVQADAQSLPFPDDRFDAAFATLVFCSIPEPSAAFAELRRVLKPGGRIVLLEHVRPAGLLGSVFDVLNVVTVATFQDHFNRDTAALARDAGLRVTEVREKLGGTVNLIICESEN